MMCIFMYYLAETPPPPAPSVQAKQGWNPCPMHWKQGVNHWTTRMVLMYYCFFLKPMEPSLLFWWVKVDKLLEEQREKENLMFP